MNCDILKSKLIFWEWNAFYFIAIAFIDFTLHEMKQCIVFRTPGRLIYKKMYVNLKLHALSTIIFARILYFKSSGTEETLIKPV